MTTKEKLDKFKKLNNKRPHGQDVEYQLLLSILEDLVNDQS